MKYDVVKRTPVLAGVCGTDPFRQMPQFLSRSRNRIFRGPEFSDRGLIGRDPSAKT